MKGWLQVLLALVYSSCFGRRFTHTLRPEGRVQGKDAHVPAESLSDLLLVANRRINLPASEPDGNLATNRYLVCGTQHAPGSVVDDGIAALEELKRATLLKLQRC